MGGSTLTRTDALTGGPGQGLEDLLRRGRQVLPLFGYRRDRMVAIAGHR